MKSGLSTLVVPTAAGLAAAWAWFATPVQPSQVAGQPHRSLHNNCPPGSHPVSRDKVNVARKLHEARAKSLTARSLTTGHPAKRQDQPNAP